MKKGKTYQLVMIIVSFFILPVSADEICEMRLNRCPEDFNNQTIIVPKKVTSIAPNFFVCMPQNVIENGTVENGSPSIMFVIDHSGSMSGLSGGRIGTDTEGSRFTVTKTLIDTIQKKYPKAEIGLVIFQSTLYLDTENQPYAVPLPSTYTHPHGYTTQGYIPLMRLDSILSNGQTTVQMIKQLLTTKQITIPGTTRQTTELVYKPTFDIDYYTNINTAFDAAKLAMLLASNPKEHQFIIFLSDGEPMPNSSRKDLHGNKKPSEFQNGTDVPTTFTVYFVENANDNIPKSITIMTENISTNNYSESNTLSNVWGIQTSYNILLNVLINQAINPIFSLIKQRPTQLVLNNKTYKGYSYVDSSFTIPDLKLNNETTLFDLTITYEVSSNTTIQPEDSSVHIKFDVIRSDSLPISNDVTITCENTTFYQVFVKATPTSISESGSESSTIQFTRDNSNNGDITVYFSVSGTATPGIDYVQILDSIIFTGNQKMAAYKVTPLKDLLEEVNETVIVTLLSQKRGRNIKYSITSPNRATVVITPPLLQDSVKITIVPNPLSIQNNAPLNTIIGNSVYSYDALPGIMEQGVLVSVFSSIPLIPIDIRINSYGKAVIYDAVGNIVQRLEIVKANERDSTLYGIIWDGTNSSNRQVGAGIYLIKIHLKNQNGVVKTYSRKIGIKF